MTRTVAGSPDRPSDSPHDLGSAGQTGAIGQDAGQVGRANLTSATPDPAEPRGAPGQVVRSFSSTNDYYYLGLALSLTGKRERDARIWESPSPASGPDRPDQFGVTGSAAAV